MQNAVKTFGIREFSPASSEIDLRVEEIRLVGYTVLPDALSPAELEAGRAKLDRIYQNQLEEIGGFDNLKTIGDPYTAMCPLAYDAFFLSLVTDRRVLAVVERLL